MAHKTQFLIVGSVVVALVVSSLACSISGQVDVDGPLATADETEEADSGGEPTTAAPTGAPSGEPTAEASETPDESGGDDAEIPEDAENPLQVSDIPELQVDTLDPTGDGLGHLATFRQRMTVNFTGEDTGYASVLHYAAEVNTSEQAVHVTITAEGPAAAELPASEIQAIWIGTQLWFKVGRQPWLPVPEAVAALQFEQQVLAVGDFLPYVLHFERVEPDETVNGIPSAHYTYDVVDAPTEYGTFTGQGDVYVALDGGYVVRYTADGYATLEEVLVGSGTFSLIYDTYDVGAPIHIEPPRLGDR
jgi:hypothetical protein